MKTIRDLMTADVVWLSPTARVKSAVLLMKGHNIGALPVVNGEGVVGLITLLNLLGEPQDAAIEEVMSRDFITIEPDTPIYDAADVMSETGAGHLVVMEDGQLVGIVSHGDLMPELGRTYDPLTDLPWSDSFREWSMNALKRGTEISLILFDLNRFGLFNKKYGHVVGDNVIKQVASVLKKGVDPDLDFLCRYGGDEFGIVTERHADEAIALADILQQRISEIQVPDLPEGVSATYGMAGGRRTKEREDVHYASTIDNLITRASKNCTANKPHRVEEAAQAAVAAVPQAAPGERAQAVVLPEGARAPRLKIHTISFSSTGTEAKAGVTLRRLDQEFKRESSGYAVGGDSILRLFAEAAAGAVCKSLAPEHGIVVEDAFIHTSGKDDEIVTIVAMYISPKTSTRLTGSALIRRGDQYRAAAAALLDAVNRLVETAPQAAPEEEPQVA